MARKERKTTGNAEIKAPAGKKLSASLASVFDNINKKMGAGTIKLTNEVENVKTISTGVPSVDVALGGGIPEGRIIEIYGPESSGKTSFCLQCAKQFQQEGEMVALIDVEQAFSKQHCQNIGVNIDDLIYVSPSSGEQALNIVQQLAETGEVKLIILDSVAALVPQSELDGEMGDAQMGTIARLMGQACRKLTPILAKTGTTVIFINQIRNKIGIMFGSNETVTGGNALKYYASQRIDVRKKGFLKEDPHNKDKVTGIEMKVKIIKNKISSPGAEVFTNFHYKGGFDSNENVIIALIDLGVIKRSGPSYSIVVDGQEYKTMGKDKMVEMVRNGELDYNKLYEMLKKATQESDSFFNEHQDENEEGVITEEDELMNSIGDVESDE